MNSMTESTLRRIVPRLLALAGALLVACIACAPAQAANVFSPGQTVGNANQFGFAVGIAVRADGQVLVADSDFSAGRKVLRFDTTNALQNTASISDTSAGAGISCVTATGGTDFIVDSPWDRPIRKYDEGGTEIGWVDGQSMWFGDGYNGNPGPGATRCIVRSGDYLFAISDRGSESIIPSLSRWNVSDLTLGPGRADRALPAGLTGLAADLVLCDPPYATPAKAIGDLLADLAAVAAIAPGATVALERPTRDPWQWPEGFHEEWDRRHGDTRLRFARRVDAP